MDYRYSCSALAYSTLPPKSVCSVWNYKKCFFRSMTVAIPYMGILGDQLSGAMPTMPCAE